MAGVAAERSVFMDQSWATTKMIDAYRNREDPIIINQSNGCGWERWSNGRGDRKGLVEGRRAGRSADIRNVRDVEAGVGMMEGGRIRAGPHAMDRR